ncbi:hypothetical protein JCGZ_03232 [Jatropha curcas]|uniref:Uncharacterized protein n=1 Tax=Jatropha curcas TaxID=180498 RepID=A0A067KY61_JATCU|nr:hypothetical protein JCGZ_03232 [Jatropha curcas]
MARATTKVVHATSPLEHATGLQSNQMPFKVAQATAALTCPKRSKRQNQASHKVDHCITRKPVITFSRAMSSVCKRVEKREERKFEKKKEQERYLSKRNILELSRPEWRTQAVPSGTPKMSRVGRRKSSEAGFQSPPGHRPKGNLPK